MLLFDDFEVLRLFLTVLEPSASFLTETALLLPLGFFFTPTVFLDPSVLLTEVTLFLVPSALLTPALFIVVPLASLDLDAPYLSPSAWFTRTARFWVPSDLLTATELLVLPLARSTVLVRILSPSAWFTVLVRVVAVVGIAFRLVDGEDRRTQVLLEVVTVNDALADTLIIMVSRSDQNQVAFDRHAAGLGIVFNREDRHSPPES